MLAGVTIYQIFWWPSIIKSEVTVRSFLDMKRDEVLKKMASIFVDVRGHCYNWMDVRFKLIHKKEYLLCKLQIFYFSLETMPRIDAFDVLRKDCVSRVLKIFHVLWCLLTKIKETKIILRNICYSPQTKNSISLEVNRRRNKTFARFNFCKFSIEIQAKIRKPHFFSGLSCPLKLKRFRTTTSHWNGIEILVW